MKSRSIRARRRAARLVFAAAALSAFTVTAAPAPREAAEPPAPSGVALRAASYNIHGGQESSPEGIGTMLALLNLDFAGLQEVPDAAFADAVREAMGFPHVYFGGGKALITRTPLADPMTAELRSGRGFIRGTLEVQGVSFSVYDAHIGWDLEGNFQNRELLDEWIAPDPNPHLVMVGDFNDEHLSSQNDILEEELDDVWTRLGLYPGERISWPSLRFDGGEGSQLIDFVWVRRAAGALVVAGDVVNLSPVLSDHKPVWAELLFPADPAAPFAEDPFVETRRADRAFPAALPPNRVLNGGFEEGTARWRIVDRMEAVSERESQAPRSGARFLAGPSCMPQARSRAEQTVSLGDQAVAVDEGRGRLLAGAAMTTGFTTLVSGDVRSNFVKPYDEAETRVELYDGAGALLGIETSKRRDTLRWHPYLGAVDLPPGTRSAKIVLTSYFKVLHTKFPPTFSSDGMFDDVYAGLEVLSEPHGVLGGNLLANGDAAGPGLAGWEATPGFAAIEDSSARTDCCAPYDVLPVWHSASGAYYFASPASPGVHELRQTADLSAYADRIAAGTLALRWGGFMRNVDAARAVSMALAFLDAGDAPLGERTIGPFAAAAEWLPYERTDAVPPGTARVRFTARAAGASDRGLFDLLRVQPVRNGP